jgi:hypothetical protein
MGSNWFSVFLRVFLAVVGALVIAAGLYFVVIQHQDEFRFQGQLLSKMGDAAEYHWRPIGNDYAGIAITAIGALMVGLAALLSQLPELQDSINSGKKGARAGADASRGHPKVAI